jgi:hypothetical protein
MLKVILLAVLLVLICGVVAVSGYARVERPAVGGSGPLAIEMPAGLSAPDYHQQPLAAWWRTRHGERVTSSAVLQECVACHNPQTSCNNCHAYVGVKPIVATTIVASVPVAATQIPVRPTIVPSASVPPLTVSATAISTNAIMPTSTAAPPPMTPIMAPSPTATALRAPSFAKDLVPILRTRCLACHGTLGRWDASTYDGVMQSGDHKPVIIPGNPDASLLIQKLLNRQTIGIEMPPGKLLSAEEIDLFIRWVAAGAPNN